MICTETHHAPGVAPLRESRHVPTAKRCADGQMWGPSAQKPSSTGDGGDRRHRPAVGTLQATPTVTVGATMAVATNIERPKVTLGTGSPVGTGAGRWAEPLRCHGAVYAVPTVAHGATSAVGPEPDNWVPSPTVPTVGQDTTSAVGTAHHFYLTFFI